MSALAERLLAAVERFEALATLREKATVAGTPARVRGASGSVASLLVAALARTPGLAVAVIAPDIERAEAWRDDLAFLLGDDRVVYLPPLDVVAWSAQTATAPVRDDRLHALLRLGDPDPP
ncbi:MAG: hypothetical protein ACRENN_06380, partial [Candidatus Eiseniibacteriota bacterium]